MESNDNISMEKIPEDLNAEVLLNYYPESALKVEFKGLHRRNSYKDILGVENDLKGTILSLGRNSIYNSLPEYLFHPIDRFNNISQHNGKEKFEEECAKQEKEKENAYKFFAPIDTLLLKLRLEIRDVVEPYISENKVLIDILCDTLSENQKRNRFIRKILPLIPYCKLIRGDKTMITLMLRKVLMEEGLEIKVTKHNMTFTEVAPRYQFTLGGLVGDVYVGDTYQESVWHYKVSYWSEDDCNESFDKFLNDMEIFRQFVQDYFLPVDSILEFDVSTVAPTLRLSDTTVFNYLNYNTYI